MITEKMWLEKKVKARQTKLKDKRFESIRYTQIIFEKER